MKREKKSDKIFQYVRKRIWDHKMATNWRGYLKDQILIEDISKLYYGNIKIKPDSALHRKLNDTIDRARDSVRNRKDYLQKVIAEWATILDCSQKTVEKLFVEGLIATREDVVRLEQVFICVLPDWNIIGPKKFEKRNLKLLQKQL
jgi:uncharacterized protein YydD (DUF2326 family)